MNLCAMSITSNDHAGEIVSLKAAQSSVYLVIKSLHVARP